jgi:RNA polymerase sigma factor (sigma-70 family)
VTPLAAQSPSGEGEDEALCRRWQIFADRAARDRLLSLYGGWVHRLARGFSKYGIDEEDLVQEGFVGLLTAFGRFQSRRGHRLTGYVVYWIRLRLTMFVVRSLGPVKVPALAAWEGRDEHFSLDDRRQGRHPERLCDLVPSMEEQLISASEAEQRRRWIEQAMHGLNGAEREILRARHLEEEALDLDALAERMSLPRPTVSMLEGRALAHMFGAHDGDRTARDVLFAGRRLRITPRPAGADGPLPMPHRERKCDNENGVRRDVAGRLRDLCNAARPRGHASRSRDASLPGAQDARGGTDGSLQATDL